MSEQVEVAEQVEQKPNMFHVYGSKSVTMKFNFRAPTAAATKAATDAGEPAPIKPDPVILDLQMLDASDILNYARRHASTNGEDAEAAAVLNWLATLAGEDIKSAIKSEFDNQPASQQINLAAVDYNALTLHAIATAPRSSRPVPLTDAEWDTFTATLAVYYREELPTKSATQFGNMAKLLRGGWRVLAGQPDGIKKKTLAGVIDMLDNFSAWAPTASEVGMVVKQGEKDSAIDLDLVSTIVGQCLAKAKKMLEAEVVALDL